MKRVTTLVTVVVICGFGGQAYAGPCDGINFDTVIFRDDFTGPNCTRPDPNHWIINDPNNWWRVQGRTFFPSTIYHPDANFPHLQDNTCVITHYRYNRYDINPNDPNDPSHVKTTFLGGEIHMIMEFEPTQCYRFEARVRWPQAPRGLVTSFFTYGYDEPNYESDEIDVEFLSNEVFDPPHYVLTNTWNDSKWDAPNQKPEQVPIPELDLTQWQTFRIYWCPDPCIRWYWLDPNGMEVLLREETDPNWVPDEPMSVYFNFWAPTADWPKAYDPNLVPDQQDNGLKYEYFIDFVEVRVPEPASSSLLALGVVWLAARRKRRLSQ